MPYHRFDTGQNTSNVCTLNVFQRFRVRHIFVAIHLWSNINVVNTFKEPIKYIFTNTSERKLTVEVASAGAPPPRSFLAFLDFFKESVRDLYYSPRPLCVMVCRMCAQSRPQNQVNGLLRKKSLWPLMKKINNSFRKTRDHFLLQFRSVFCLQLC